MVYLVSWSATAKDHPSFLLDRRSKGDKSNSCANFERSASCASGGTASVLSTCTILSTWTLIFLGTDMRRLKEKPEKDARADARRGEVGALALPITGVMLDRPASAL